MNSSPTLTTCFHCGLPVTDKNAVPVNINGALATFCCPGCEAVSLMIQETGLGDYYRFRSQPAMKAEPVKKQQYDIFDNALIQEEFVTCTTNGNETQLTVEGISCAACGWLIEKSLARLEGIKLVAVNVSARRISLRWEPSQLRLSQILIRLDSIGYRALPFQPDQHEISYLNERKQFLMKLGLSGLMSMQVMMLAIGLYFSLFGYIEPDTRQYFHVVSLLLTLPVVTYAAKGFYSSAIKAIKLGSINMDVPISVAIIATFCASAWTTTQGQGEVYFESVCMFVFLLLISRFLEHNARHKAIEIAANMHKVLPISANIMCNGEVSLLPAKLLKPGDVVLVKAGETIPVDAQVISGKSEVNEALLSGEFAPVSKKPQSEVYAGTINLISPLILKVTKPLSQSAVTQILNLQELALATKPHIAQLADRLSRYFVVSVLALAITSGLIWWQLGNPQAFWIAISIMVATCPCALGLATPMSLTCAMAALHRQGILVKRSDALSQLRLADTILFDKTGTLTEGKFSLRHWQNHSSYSDEQLLALAKSLESYSEHPIARAFQQSDVASLEISNVTVVPSLGVEGHWHSKTLRIGQASFALDSSNGADDDAIYLSADFQPLASFYVADALRDDSILAIRQLKGARLEIVSGDNQKTVDDIAEQLNIADKYGRCTPRQKLARLEQLQQHHRVIMVGDGINDGPVLAKADVSVAVANATDLARNAADILLLNQSLTSLVTLRDVANATHNNIRQNLAWALGYNLTALPLAMLGWLTPWMAVIGMSLSSFIVVANAGRLLHRANQIKALN